MPDVKVIEAGTDYEVRMTYKNGKPSVKCMDGPDAHYRFHYDTGLMISWGKTAQEDPVKYPAPTILDMEVTTICKHGCPFCYKSNTGKGINMSFDTFRNIIDILPKTLTQVAFGADYDLTSNPDLWKMMEYARSQEIVPNITLGYCSDEVADNLAKYCGACAVSRYEDKDACYDSIKRLTDRGMTQVNMHYMIAEETYDRALETIEDIATDPRLAKLNAIVFLSLKQKGRGTGFHPLSQEKFSALAKKAQEKGINLGFDSCSSLKALRALGPKIMPFVAPCESSLESSYINVHGQYSPCSFCEGSVSEWKDGGLDVLGCKDSQDFIDKIWNNPRTEKFRAMLLMTADCNEHKCRTCPLFNV